MKRLGVVFAVVATLGACNKREPAADRPGGHAPTTPSGGEAPPVVHGPTAAKADPANLPAAGTAPPSVALAKETPMWNAAINTLQGQATSLAAFRGKALLLVNVASRCGNTPQYAALEALQRKYAARGFTVVGFPCNQFGKQEPGTAAEIETFCSTTYGVTFPMMEKVEVNGAGAHPIYQQLTTVADASGHTGAIRWNFEKFVVSADGSKITRFAPDTEPDDPSVIAAVEASLP